MAKKETTAAPDGAAEEQEKVFVVQTLVRCNLSQAEEYNDGGKGRGHGASTPGISYSILVQSNDEFETAPEGKDAADPFAKAFGQ